MNWSTTSTRSGSSEILQLNFNPNILLMYFVFLCSVIFTQIIIFVAKGQTNTEYNCYLDVALLVILIAGNVPVTIMNIFIYRRVKGANEVMNLDRRGLYQSYVYSHTRALDVRAVYNN
eukprot:TRINITY_DN2405_c0_g2_i1.p1 TRINITY_DN2405_c0_g2~~TRINITY_DN2405_c0_g2_i1.p1  ORF type:complete len:118 (+),score=5.49 TRINITY_DN2405_c0_g2_i1:25-378(+)